MCLTNRHNTYSFTLEKLILLTNTIILAIDGHETLRPLGIYWRPFANGVRDTKYHKYFSDQRSLPPLIEISHLLRNLEWVVAQFHF